MESKIEAWLIALRPQTLPASVCPVFLGSCLAYAQGFFHLFTAVCAFLVALFLQLAVNLANDYFDHKKGVDTNSRVGFSRACASGLLEPRQVKYAMILFLLLSLLPGSFMIYVGGFPLLAAGILSILGVLLYSGGPLPFGSIALGDTMVFVFFGIVATAGTYYAQFCANLPITFPSMPPDSSIYMISILSSIPIGSISTSILVVNNIRDRPQDKKNGKYTLAVILGDWGSILEYNALMTFSYLIPISFWLFFDYSAIILLPLLTLPFGFYVSKQLSSFQDRNQLNSVLERTVQLLVLFSITFGMGLIL